MHNAAIEHILVEVFDDPCEVSRAVTAEIAVIYRHESQKDKALFPGDDQCEFWQRTEDRNRTTARMSDALGMAEYEAIEALVLWNPVDRLNSAPALLQDADEV